LSSYLWSLRHISNRVLILTRKLMVMKILLVLYDLLLLQLNVQKLRDPLLTHHRVKLIIINLMVHLMISLVPISSTPSWDYRAISLL
jgi:hypothetical protein